LLAGSQAIYKEIYRRADRPQRQLQIMTVFLSTLPLYALEAPRFQESCPPLI
jgi:hypothetical protein